MEGSAISPKERTITHRQVGPSLPVRQHIEAGADLNAREPSGGSSPLITAATFGQTEAARALIEAGADKSIRNSTGSTALDVVTVPFDALKGSYDYLGAVLAPDGLVLDYEEIRMSRPQIAEMLR